MGMMEIASFTDPCEEHFHIFMPLSFPLKTVKGGGMDPAWHVAFDAFTTELLKWINGTRQESCWQSRAVSQSEMTAGWANGTGGGWGLAARKSPWWSPLSPSSLLPLLL